MPKNKKLDDLYHKIGLMNHITDDKTIEIIESQYKFMKETIQAIDFKTIEEEEEFNKLKTNFILKYIGKLHTNYKTLKKIQKLSKKKNEGSKKL